MASDFNEFENKKAESHERLAPENSAKPIKTYMTPNYTINGVDVNDFLINNNYENVYFDDIVGMDEAKKIVKSTFLISKEELAFKKHIGIMHNSNRFILLYGVSGSGKSYFANAISNEFRRLEEDDSIPYFNVNYDALYAVDHNQILINVDSLFKCIKQFDKCVVNINLADMLFRPRLDSSVEFSYITTQIINIFLGFYHSLDSNNKVLIIAQTEYPQHIDPVIMTKFTEMINIPIPSKEEIKGMIKQGMRSLVDEEVLEEIVNRCGHDSRRGIKYLIERFKQKIFDQYVAKQFGEDFNAYKVTLDMVNEVFKSHGSFVRESDLKIINEFRKNNLI